MVKQIYIKKSDSKMWRDFDKYTHEYGSFSWAIRQLVSAYVAKRKEELGYTQKRQT